MATSIDYYLRSLATKYYLKNDSDEVKGIEGSINNLFNNFEKELGNKIKRKFIFGSYDRDTILPRKFDSKSDVDVMIIFNHTDYERTPETYRSWLKSFADKYYKDRYGSEVIKSFPTVTIRLNNIHYDLVPAKEEDTYFGKVLSIPNDDSYDGWIKTDPNDVKGRLTTANTAYDGIVRPIIRLMKAWNCNVGRPFDSYFLELELTQKSYYNDNVQTGFFYAVDQMIVNYGDSQFRKDKIESLKYNIGNAKVALSKDDYEGAKRWIHRVLPES